MDPYDNALNRKVSRISSRQVRLFHDAVKNFRKGIGLGSWNPIRSVPLDFFGHSRMWTPPARQEEVQLEYVDHPAYCSIRGGRLAVVMSWPYASRESLLENAEMISANPRFLVSVDEQSEYLDNNSVRKGNASVYAHPGTVGWIIADRKTLGEERAEEISKDFLNGSHGFRAAVLAQGELDELMSQAYREAEQEESAGRS